MKMTFIQRLGVLVLLWLGLSITAAAQQSGNHDVGSCSVIAGWAWDSNQPTSPVSVDIYLRRPSGYATGGDG